ncbi:MAG TPA: sigma-70 family RNA polymerase sigma factor, partial [Acidimicrobiia bacterium]
DRETREATELAELYRANATELTRFATMLVGPGRAEDVVSEAMTRVLATVPAATVANLRAYLYRAVLNQSRRTLRSDDARRRREHRFIASHVTATAVEPDEEVSAAVADLSDRQRAVVFFTYWQDLEPRAIAAVLDISEGAVRRHLARARARLRRILADESR